MNESGRHLNLVLNESGDDPLVLESTWTGDPKRHHPDLLDAGHAKRRLRAICILLLLAKYQGRPVTATDAPFPFQVDFKTGTWIYTLANGKQDLLDWIKLRFHIRDDDLFLSTSVGSTHNPGGMEPPLVNFHPKMLPPVKLHF